MKKIEDYMLKHYEEMYAGDFKGLSIDLDIIGFYCNEDTDKEIVWVTEHPDTGKRANIHYDRKTKKVTHVIKEDSKRFTEEIYLKGFQGTWYVIDSKVINGRLFKLLEHEDLGDCTNSVIVRADLLRFKEVEKDDIAHDEVFNGFQDYIDALED